MSDCDRERPEIGVQQAGNGNFTDADNSLVSLFRTVLGRD